jgi:hypothetical protein
MQAGDQERRLRGLSGEELLIRKQAWDNDSGERDQ